MFHFNFLNKGLIDNHSTKYNELIENKAEYIVVFLNKYVINITCFVQNIKIFFGWQS